MDSPAQSELATLRSVLHCHQRDLGIAVDIHDRTRLHGLIAKAEDAIRRISSM